MESPYVNRIIRAAKLEPGLYEEVEADPHALGQAMGVVVFSSVAAGIGSIRTAGLPGIIMGTLAALIGWYVWAYITYFVGTKWLPEPQTRSNHGELLRTIGFSSSPGIIRLFGFIPGLTWTLMTVGGIWMLIAMVVAVKQALDYQSTLRAVGVCVIGWIIQALIVGIILALFSGCGTTSR